MNISLFVQAIVDNNIGKVESLINKYKKQENTNAFPNGLNVLTTYTFKNYISDQIDYPLHVAAKFGHIRIIKLLIKAAAQPVNQPNKYGETPLVAALSKPSSNIVNTVKTLLNLGSSLQGDKSNMTPLHWATYHSLESVIKLLIEKDKTSIYSMNIHLYTPVSFATSCEKSIMNIYYYTDPDILITGLSLLHQAVFREKDEMVKHLFWLGLPISYLEWKKKYNDEYVLPINEQTPLNLALFINGYNRGKRMIALLLALGADADPDVRREYGLHTENEVTAIRYDCFFSRSLVSRLLPFCMISE
jgi:ankyrin repeat protein